MTLTELIMILIVATLVAANMAMHELRRRQRRDRKYFAEEAARIIEERMGNATGLNLISALVWKADEIGSASDLRLLERIKYELWRRKP